MDSANSETLGDALARHQIELPDDQVSLLEQYCTLLWEWNKKLNLTRHADLEKFVARDVVDSLELSKLLAASEKVLDVGSGGGVPGVILAIVRPDLRLTLCESVQKKAAALQAIVSRLELPVAMHAARAEDLLTEKRFDTLVARAVGPLWKMLKWFEPHWDSIGRLLAIKGPGWVEERGEARHRGYLKPLELRKAASYPMPGTQSESVILQMWPKGRSEL